MGQPERRYIVCIIIVKPAGVSVPSETIIREAWGHNPDGAGIAVATGKTVKIRKGLMHLKDLMRAVKRIKTDESAIIHLRIATSGGIRGDVCHPYPVTDNVAKLRKTTVTDTIALAHNGIISGMATDGKTSDTMAFVRDIVAPLRRLSPDLLHNDDALSILETVADSKLALLNHSGDIVTIGDFITDDGLLYSNASYKPYVYGVSHKHDTAYSVWADWDKYADETAPITGYPDYAACDVCRRYDDCCITGARCVDASDASDFVTDNPDYTIFSAADYDSLEVI